MKIADLPREDAAIETVEAYVKDARASLTRLTLIELSINGVERSVERNNSACKSRSLHSLLNFDSLMRSGVFTFSLPQANYLFEVNTEYIPAFIRMISMNIVASKVSEQNEKFQEAISRAPSKIISEEEVFQLSSRICEARNLPYQAIRDKVRSVGERQLVYVELARRALVSRLNAAEPKLLRLRKEQIELATTADEFLEAFERIAFLSQLTLQQALIRSIITQRTSSLATAECTDWLEGWEGLLGYISEALVQADALSLYVEPAVRVVAQKLSADLRDVINQMEDSRPGEIALRCR